MRRIIRWLAALAILAAAAYGGYWYHMAGKLRAGIDPWAEARRAEGYDLRWDGVSVGGFPWGFRLRFDNFFVASPKPLPYQASADSMVFEAGPWNLQAWRFAAPGGAKLDLLLQSAGFDVSSLSGDVTLPLDPEGALDIDALNLTGRGIAEGLKIGELRLGLSQPAKPPVSDRDPFLDLSVTLSHVVLTQGVAPLSDTIQEISVLATVDGAFFPGPLAPALTAWRDRGGIVELQSVHVRWDALDVSANGTGALDARLQPIAALTANVEGQDAIVDAAVGNGVMSAQNGDLAKMVLGLLAKPGPDGQKQITAPLTVQDNRLYLGPATVARVPVINWE
ncbi:MAG TPA: DUF2125 domain-containing protein [Stellaceae bacterium]|nr:DUF2125 domain-containing protein [Stellaceae bacterium]